MYILGPIGYSQGKLYEVKVYLEKVIPINQEFIKYLQSSGYDWISRYHYKHILLQCRELFHSGEQNAMSYQYYKEKSSL